MLRDIYNTFSVHWYLVHIMQMLRLHMNFILCLKTLSSVFPEIHDIHLNCHKNTNTSTFNILNSNEMSHTSKELNHVPHRKPLLFTCLQIALP